MSDVVIRVENLSKLYRIGERLPYRTLRETIIECLKAPYQRLGAARSLAHRALGKRKDSSLPTCPVKSEGHFTGAPSSLPAEGTSPLQAPRSSPSSPDDTIWALKDVSFDIKRGEVVGIIGRNGAGKTTLLKILSRITKPTSGYAEVFGRVGSLLEVGTGFHPELTGHENVYLYGAILGMDYWEVTRKFDDIVAFAELDKFIDTPVKRYSSGMYMRLAFAVAAHLEPEILLVDEVLAVGDAAFQRKCLGKMGDVSKEGRTVLFVSHNMAAIRYLCSRSILLHNGRCSYDGIPQTTISKYIQTLDMELSKNKLQFEETDNKAQIQEIKLLTDLGSDNTIDYTIPISFEINCQVNESCSGIYLGVNIVNQYEDRLIFWRDFELLPELLDSRKVGTYIYQITIPGHVLSPGIYYVHIALIELLGFKPIHVPKEFLGFEVSDHLSVRRVKNLPWNSLTSIPIDLDVIYRPRA